MLMMESRYGVFAVQFFEFFFGMFQICAMLGRRVHSEAREDKTAGSRRDCGKYGRMGLSYLVVIAIGDYWLCDVRSATPIFR